MEMGEWREVVFRVVPAPPPAPPAAAAAAEAAEAKNPGEEDVAPEPSLSALLDELDSSLFPEVVRKPDAAAAPAAVVHDEDPLFLEWY